MCERCLPEPTATKQISLSAQQHSCILYEREPKEYLPALARFIQEGFARNRQFIYIADDQSVEELAQGLERHGIDVARETGRGALKLWTREQWRQPGKLDSRTKAAQVRQFVEAAQAAGFEGALFAVEMTWTLNPDISSEELSHWEATINTLLVPQFPASIVCLYNRSRLCPDIILAGLQTHPVAIVGNQIHHNSFYEAPLILSRNGHPIQKHGGEDRSIKTNGHSSGPRVDWLVSQLENGSRLQKVHLDSIRTEVALAESQRTERKLQASEERFRLLANSSPVLIWMDSPRGCEFVNRRFLEFFGKEESEILGTSWTTLVHPADQERWTRSYEEALAKQAEFSAEHRSMRKDGKWCWFLTRGVPHHEPDGALRGFILTSTDIDSQKTSELASQRLAAIVESSDDAIVGKDLNGIITSWNKASERIFGYTAEEVIGRPIELLIPQDRRQEEPRILARIRRGERVDHFETIRRRKDGGLINISLTISPIRNSDGTIVGASKIARDITERNAREQALREAQQELAKLNAELEDRVRQRTAELGETIEELESFSYSITHDLRAPLRSMQSFATMLEEDCEPQVNATGKDYIRRIVTSARRMDRLIQDVLIYSKVARSELHLEVVHTDQLVQGILESYPGFHSDDALIEVRRPLLKVLANEAALTQCLSNLIGNAIKFVKPGSAPQVTIWSEPAQDRVRIYVQDRGIGIPSKHQERIFGIFQRLSKAYEGTGIGLSIVKKAAERMGGAVGLQSEPGKGSVFWLELQSVKLEPVPNEYEPGSSALR
jgi:PAS domain S-box-containing protein